MPNKTRQVRPLFKQLRRAKGTQEFVGSEVGVTRAMISYIENGNTVPSGKLMFKLSNYFNTPVNELFPDVEREAFAELLSQGGR